MTSVYKTIALIAFLIVTTRGGVAGEIKRDAWLGRDKFTHYGYSAFLSTGAAMIAGRHFDRDDNDSIVVGLGFSISIGAGKEAIDYFSPNQTSSGKDLIWDIAGALTGAALASLIL